MNTISFKRLVLLLSVALMFDSCNFENESNEGTQNVAGNTNAVEEAVPDEDTMSHVDSFKVYCDKMMKTNVVLPPVYQHEIFAENEEATDKFSKLSKACNGFMKVIINSSTVVNELQSTIKAVSAEQSDMVILIDRTGSMTGHIERVKEGITQIIDTIKKYKGTRLAIATYGDKNYDDCALWFTFRNFETDYDSAARYVKGIQTMGNPDWPESVYDAVMQCMQSKFWRSRTKCNIVLVGDAPPQEKPYCDYTLEDVVKASKARKVKMNFYPILILPAVEEVKLSKEDEAKYKKITGNTRLYPNPCRNVLSLSFEKTASYYVEIYDMGGQMVVTEKHFGIIWQKDISNLPNGVYTARVINEDHTFELFKFILQHE